MPCKLIIFGSLLLEKENLMASKERTASRIKFPSVKNMVKNNLIFNILDFIASIPDSYLSFERKLKLSLP